MLTIDYFPFLIGLKLERASIRIFIFVGCITSPSSQNKLSVLEI